MAKGTVRIGFVGAGRNTRARHIPGFRKVAGVEFVSVANRSRESSERVAKEFGIARVYDRWQDLVAADDTDAICIGTWPYLHREITEAALDRGKHVLCEARMAMNAAEGRRMLAASRRHPKLVAQLVPSPLTLPVDTRLTALVREGYLGELFAIELRGMQGAFVDREAPLHWRQDAELSGFNILNMGIWYEAMMRWVGPAVRVMAAARVVVPERRDATGAMKAVTVPDHVDILATLGGGAIAHLRFSSVTALAPSNEVWLYGSDGTLRLDASALRLHGGRRGDTALAEIAIPESERVGWRVEEEFVNAIRGQEQVRRTTFEDGVRYMEFTDAVTRSFRSGAAVDVPGL